MNYLPKIEYGPGPTIILFEFPPSGDYLNTDIDASETTNISFNGKIQTSWGYNQVTINPRFQFINQTLKDEIELFFNAWASKGEPFKYYPSSDAPDFYVVVSKSKKFVPKIDKPGDRNSILDPMSFFWSFDFPMLAIDPGLYAITGSPVTSVNTRIGNVFVREIYNQSETDIIAVGTNTGLDLKLVNVPDTNQLIQESGRLAFTTLDKKFVGFDGVEWKTLGSDIVGPTTTVVNQLAQFDSDDGKIIKNTAYTIPNTTGTTGQYLSVTGTDILGWTNLPAPSTTAVNISGPPVIANNLPKFSNTTGTVIIDSGIEANKIAKLPIEISLVGTDIDWSVADSFYFNITGNITLTFSNLIAVKTVVVTVINATAGDLTITFPTAKWSEVVTTVKANKTNVYTLMNTNGIIYGAVIKDMA